MVAQSTALPAVAEIAEAEEDVAKEQHVREEFGNLE
jgi:hypothetical protein